MQNIDTSTRPKIRVQSVNIEQVENSSKQMLDIIAASLKDYLDALVGLPVTPLMGSGIADVILGMQRTFDVNLGNLAHVQRVNPEACPEFTMSDSCARILEDEDCAKDESFALKP